MARTIWGKHTINLDSTVNIDVPAAVVKRPTLTERLNVRRRAKPPPGRGDCGFQRSDRRHVRGRRGAQPLHSTAVTVL